MSTKVIGFPSNPSVDDEYQGWVWDGDKWVSDSTGGGSSLWEQNGDDIYYSDGNVSIGRNDASGKLTVYDPADASISLQSNGSRWWIKSETSSNVLSIGGNGGSAPASGAISIDATGDATFSGTVSSKGITANPAAYSSNVSGSYLRVEAPKSDGSVGFLFDHKLVSDAGGVASIKTCGTTGQELYSLDKSGNATFSGTLTAGSVTTVTAAAARGYISGGAGYDYTGNPTQGKLGTLTLSSGSSVGSGGSVAFAATQNGQHGFAAIKGFLTGGTSNTEGHLEFYTRKASADAEMSKVLSLMSTGNAHFTGTVSDGSGPLMSTRGLITTLTTLRNATMDETKDIRESLRSAIDELVTGFEQEIAAMPAPETGTMEISE